MDYFSIFGLSFDTCSSNLTKVLQIYVENKLILREEKYHFMVQERIILGHQVNKHIDKAKIEVIKGLPPPTNLK